MPEAEQNYPQVADVSRSENAADRDARQVRRISDFILRELRDQIPEGPGEDSSVAGVAIRVMTAYVALRRKAQESVEMLSEEEVPPNVILHMDVIRDVRGKLADELNGYGTAGQPTNFCEADAAAARRFAGEIERLRAGLDRAGIQQGAGPWSVSVSEWPVTAALDTISSYRARLTIATAEAENLRRSYLASAAQVARMHEAAVGEVRAPIRGLVEDVEDLRAKAADAIKALGIANALLGRANQGEQAEEDVRAPSERLADQVAKQAEAMGRGGLVR